MITAAILLVAISLLCLVVKPAGGLSSAMRDLQPSTRKMLFGRHGVSRRKLKVPKHLQDEVAA